MTAAPTDVINWEEAMQQVGDDEEFLRELLADLRSETETQLGAIATIIQVRVCLWCDDFSGALHRDWLMLSCFMNAVA